MRRALRWCLDWLLFAVCWLVLWVLERIWPGFMLFLCLALLPSCADPFAVFGAEPFTPPASYRAVWDSAQACTHRSGRFEALTFYLADRLLDDGQVEAGITRDRTIFILRGWELHPMVVKHEMIHALGVHHHPSYPFRYPCHATWDSYHGDGYLAR